MNSKTNFILYGLYAAAAAGVFLYLLFPSRTISALIVERIAQTHSDVRVGVQETQPVFPPGLKLQPIELEYGPFPVLRMPHLKVTPSLFSMVGNEKQVAFKGPLGHGSLMGNASFYLDGPIPQTRVVMNLADVPLDVFDALDQWTAGQLAGNITAYLDFDSRKGSGGTTNVKMQVVPVKVMLNQPLIGISEMAFSQLEAELSITQRTLQVKRFEFSGNQIEGKIMGTIVFQQPLGKSRLSLSCTLKPQPAFLAEHRNDMIGAFLGSPSVQQRGIVVKIAGTLDNPSYAAR
jgi:type II secretion system protein N